MEINGYFITAVRPRASINVSKCSAGYSILANGRAIQLKNPKKTRMLITNLAKLLKKPIVKR